MRRITSILLLLLASLSLHAANVTVSGVVLDSLSREPVPYAAVFLEGTQRGTLTDEQGRFSITTAQRVTGVRVSVMGFTTKTVPPGRNLTIYLTPTGIALRELSVRPGREHYSKRNNPAVDFMEHIRRGQDLTDPLRNPYYNYDSYERFTLAIDDVDPGDSTGQGGTALLRRFPQLKEFMDTSTFTGRPILNMSIREKSSVVNHRANPRLRRETITGFRSEGIDGMLDPQATQTIYEDILRQIDIYQNDITLMQNRFVSPLSRIAADFYKFYLTDTVAVGADTCIVLSFTPHNPASFGFVGKLYVPKNDSTFFVKRIEMSAPRDINLNFIRNLRIVQEYERAPDGSRLLMLDDMVVEAGVLSSDNQLYARRITARRGHNFNPPADTTVFERRAPVLTLDGSESRGEDFWRSRRFVHISKAENSVAQMLNALRRNPVYYWGEKFLRILVTGYVPTGKPSKINIGPVNTFVSFNDLEGLRLRAGAMTTGNLSRRWFARAYAAYGLRDHRWKYYGELEYSFHDKDKHSREFPVHSLRLTHLYDVDMLGQHFAFTNQDNFFLSLRRAKDTMMSYHRVSSLLYTLELESHFSVTGEMRCERQEPSRYIALYDGRGRFYNHWTTSSFEVTLRYAPGETFYQTTQARLPVNMDAPIIQLRHKFAPGGCLGNRFALNVTEISFQKRFWLSAFGYIDALAKGGHVWSRATWLNLLIPNANLSYTIQPETYALMNPLEFVNDSYLSWDVTYWANGALFNLIPGWKKLRLREVVCFRGLWGHLSDKNNPAYHPELLRFPPNAFTHTMNSTPYMEVSVGLDNIFRVLRLDYVWRLSYRHTPGAPDSGLRLALHFSF